ncbi:MAG TPA: MarR family transcriptional regulator [Longimicrobiales bacterium]|nr:MarR family transcriptional regulator [Longimicrobiales bacterium]
MYDEQKIERIRELMGASHVFCSAVNDLLDRTLAATSEEQLAMSQVKLLLLIARPGHRFKVSDVASFLGVTNAAASRAIERLVQRRLVDRTISPDDRRAVDLALTDESRALLERFNEARDGELLALLGAVEDEKLKRVTSLLDELSVLLLDLDSGGEERCLRCGVHFRSGCVVRDVLGRECAVSSALYGRDAHGAEDVAAS